MNKNLHNELRHVACEVLDDEGEHHRNVELRLNVRGQVAACELIENDGDQLTGHLIAFLKKLANEVVEALDEDAVDRLVHFAD
jgi:hypothetical protein